LKYRDDVIVLHVVAMGWMYVVLTMALAEALAPNGTVLGALFTFILYGALPLAIVLYLGSAPARRRARLAADTSAAQPDGGGHAPGDAVATKREEP
jgi:heme A synthase